jgi:hypothetical protein
MFWVQEFAGQRFQSKLINGVAEKMRDQGSTHCRPPVCIPRRGIGMQSKENLQHSTVRTTTTIEVVQQCLLVVQKEEAPKSTL